MCIFSVRSVILKKETDKIGKLQFYGDFILLAIMICYFPLCIGWSSEWVYINITWEEVTANSCQINWWPHINSKLFSCADNVVDSLQVWKWEGVCQSWHGLFYLMSMIEGTEGNHRGATVNMRVGILILATLL